MTDEIKNILDYLKRSDKNKFGFEQGKLIDYEEAQLLLDYITNLQQENKAKTHQIEVLEEIVNYERNIRNVKLQQENKELNRMCELYSKSLYNAELTDYKSRCEKANELLKLPIVYETHQENGERDELLKKIRQAKDILNGSDENE